MFTSHEHLKRKTPEEGINRREFIGHLVDEYYTTTDIEAQEQVTANLANFAYDPINWRHLIEAETLPLFVELLSLPNERLQLHAVAGLCNICFDPKALKFLTTLTNFSLLSHLFLKTENPEIVLNCITLLYQLLTAPEAFKFTPYLAATEIVKRVAYWQEHSSDKRLLNVSDIYLQDVKTLSSDDRANSKALL